MPEEGFSPSHPHTITHTTQTTDTDVSSHYSHLCVCVCVCVYLSLRVFVSVSVCLCPGLKERKCARQHAYSSVLQSRKEIPSTTKNSNFVSKQTISLCQDLTYFPLKAIISMPPFFAHLFFLLYFGGNEEASSEKFSSSFLGTGVRRVL